MAASLRRWLAVCLTATLLTGALAQTTLRIGLAEDPALWTAFGADDLVAGDNVFVAATGVTSGVFLRGVRTSGVGVETESIVMRSRSGTVRQIAAYHPSEKVRSLMKGDRDGRQ